MATELSPISMRHWKRLDGIDLLRGLAIFFVLVEHVHIRLALAKVPYTKFLPAQLWHFLVGNGELGRRSFLPFPAFSLHRSVYGDGRRFRRSMCAIFTRCGLLALRLCFSYCSRYSAACILPMFPTTS